VDLGFVSRCNADLFFFDGHPDVTFISGLIRLSIHRGTSLLRSNPIQFSRRDCKIFV
jgi:hypothetical protein